MKRLLLVVVALLALVVPFVVMAQEATPEATMDMMMEGTAEATDMMDMELIELEPVDPLSVEGDIIAAGSSTVYPVTEAMAVRFTDEGFGGQITVESIGSGAGFERFCEAGDIDIANASRAIRDTEIESCQALDPAREPIEFFIGLDALAVVVSAENDFVEELTLAQLSMIFSGEAALWSDVDASYPAEPIQLFSPGSDSGTFDYFVEAVLEAEDGGNLGDDAEAALLNAAGIQFSEDDNVLVQGVEGSPYAIGYFGFAYYQEEADALRALTIDGVEPNAETAEDGSYPLSRPLFIYSDAGIIAEKPQVGAFISFYLQNVEEVLAETGYFPASIAEQNVSRQALLDLMAMGS